METDEGLTMKPNYEHIRELEEELARLSGKEQNGIAPVVTATPIMATKTPKEITHEIERLINSAKKCNWDDQSTQRARQDLERAKELRSELWNRNFHIHTYGGWNSYKVELGTDSSEDGLYAIIDDILDKIREKNAKYRNEKMKDIPMDILRGLQ